MRKRLRIYSYLLNNSYKEVHQAFIHSACQVLPAYTCRIVKELREKGILDKNYRNSVFVKDPLRLAFAIAFNSRAPEPITFDGSSFTNIMSVLENTNYALSLDSAEAIYRDKNPDIVYAYVLGRDIGIIESAFKRSFKRYNLIVYPSDIFYFAFVENKRGMWLTSKYTLFVDLLREYGSERALKFAKDFKLFNSL